MCDAPRQGTEVVPRQGTVGMAKEHCAKKFSNDLPPTPEVPLHRQPAVCCVTNLHACLRDEGILLSYLYEIGSSYAFTIPV